jgi:hypothetical protein
MHKSNFIISKQQTRYKSIFKKDNMPFLTEQKLRLAIREEIETSREYRNLSPRQKYLLEQGVVKKVVGAIGGAIKGAVGKLFGGAKKPAQAAAQPAQAAAAQTRQKPQTPQRGQPAQAAPTQDQTAKTEKQTNEGLLDNASSLIQGYLNELDKFEKNVGENKNLWDETRKEFNKIKSNLDQKLWNEIGEKIFPPPGLEVVKFIETGSGQSPIANLEAGIDELKKLESPTPDIKNYQTSLVKYKENISKFEKIVTGLKAVKEKASTNLKNVLNKLKEADILSEENVADMALPSLVSAFRGKSQGEYQDYMNRFTNFKEGVEEYKKS